MVGVAPQRAAPVHQLGAQHCDVPRCLARRQERLLIAVAVSRHFAYWKRQNGKSSTIFLLQFDFVVISPLWHIIYVLAMLDFLAPHRIPADCAKEQWPLIMNIGNMSANTLNLWKNQQPVAPSRINSHHPSHLGFPCWNGSAPRHVFECLHDALHTAWDESKRGVLDVASRC